MFETMPDAPAFNASAPRLAVMPSDASGCVVLFEFVEPVESIEFVEPVGLIEFVEPVELIERVELIVRGLS
jgi:hypothetical protein